MNLEKLKTAEKDFFEMYPGGFSHPDMEKLAKKHKPEKMHALAQESFAKEKFSNPEEVVEKMTLIISRSSMVSLFEKPKFKDFVKSLPDNGKEILAASFKEFLYGNEQKGFETFVDSLKQGKLAKWSLVTICPAYFRPQKEVFVKPTTAKGIIQHFEVQSLEYKPAPTYAFYKEYRKVINEMKSKIDPLLCSDNAAFSGFLMMSIGCNK